GEYHMFYQWFPLGPVHGIKYWYHVSSTDLVNWKDCGMALSPTEYFESHGVFSGSGIAHEEQLYLMYTGNTRDEAWVRTPYQCVAIMNKAGEMTKLDKAVINGSPAGYTDHFRDPKVFKVNDVFYALIGAQTDEEIGTVVYYESKDLLTWEFKGEIKTTFKGNGFMWECPDYFELNNQAVMVLSPQGMAPEGDKYQNIFQSGYLVGNPIDFNKGDFAHGEFTELDRGFEFYAPQTMEDQTGRRLLVGWMGLPEVDSISSENGWVHCLTVPRELSLNGTKLIQKPVEELKLLRTNKKEITASINQEEKSFEGISGQVYEMMCEFTDISGTSIGVKLRQGKTEETVFTYDLNEKKLILDRSQSGRLSGDEYGHVRRCDFNADYLKLQIFVDVSSIEIFVNDGEEVFTTRIYTDALSNDISFFANGSTNVNVQLWDIK
ncbi:MAG TPA: sucrose-6-phosphate hydrolase, partial [Firmicutes bacterium]|nr:sucrose-6-phosphate hydrolase [Bacillota bacterium]